MLEEEDVHRQVKDASKKSLGMKAPRVDYDLLQLVCALDSKLNRENPKWTKPVTGSGVDCQICQLAIWEKII